MTNRSALGSLSLVLALGLWPAAAFAQANNSVLLTTITNPTPADYDIFGGAVAAMGSDRLLIGSEGAAEVYLFDLNGRLLTTFTNPDPQNGGGFGAAIAAGGGDKLLIGSYNYVAGVSQVGRAYLFTTNGVLQSTFTNPAPAKVQAFGWAVAGLGNDRAIFSGLADVSQPAPYPGTVYLFRTNGTLLTTFTNPIPAFEGGFGTSIAAVGGDRVLVGSPQNNTGASGAGAAYLFGTNGALVATFTNPVPAVGDNFGQSVAAVGSDRVLISAIEYGNAKGTGGSAYLFSTNGTLLTTFTNPTPAAYDYFGWSVAAVGSTRVLIGAYQDSTGNFQDGTAYLFSTNGTLLNTFTNPTPARQDWFAWSVAGVGSDHVLIGGVWDDSGATDAGSAYLYSLPLPPLSIARSAGTVSLSWATDETGLSLQQSDFLGTSPAWNNTTNLVSVNGKTNVVQQPIINGPSNRFYRLHRP
jgi:hypothetical protein